MAPILAAWKARASRFRAQKRLRGRARGVEDSAAVNPFDLTGHVALVTGGNGGIGLGLAQALLGAGARVAIWGTSEDKNARAVETLGEGAAAFACDIADEAAVDGAMAATLERFGRLDSCFANAGTAGGGKRFTDIPLSEWQRIVRVNLDGTFLTLRAAARHMIERGEGGSLVATSSLTAIEGAPQSEHYAASKSGVVALIQSLAVELARHGIRANALMPGWIETDLNRALLQSEIGTSRILPRIPQRRFGAPEDLGAAAVYLASPGARYHTGDVLVIDGGYRLF
jgi:NAD(P)-dependent dehydrogenase (short-subunit alcohol dehydrogenase family)